MSDQANVENTSMSDHTISRRFCLKDPDGNEGELYVDAEESVWKHNPAVVVSPIKPLNL